MASSRLDVERRATPPVISEKPSGVVDNEKEIHSPGFEDERPPKQKNKVWTALRNFYYRLEAQGRVESRGCAPVPYEERTVTTFMDIFSLWFCMSCNPSP